MPDQTWGSTQDGEEPQLAAIQHGYELAKAHIASATATEEVDGGVPDTIALDVALPKPPLTVSRGVRAPEVGGAPPTAGPRHRRPRWGSALLPRLFGPGLPAS
ncbi:hypothetical protein ACI797_18520 [Geodermatophilus sp. SYSU D00691]